MSPHRFRRLLLVISLALTTGPIALGVTPDHKYMLLGKNPAQPVDAWGDPLPPGVVARLGTGRLCQPRTFFLAFSPDDKTLAAVDLDGGLRLWDVRTGKEHWRFRGRVFPGWGADCMPAAFSQDGKQIAFGCPDKSVRVFDAATGKELHKFDNLADQMVQLAFSPDGRRLAAGGWRLGAKPVSVLVWDLDSEKAINSWGDFGSISSLAYTADGKSLLAVAPKSNSMQQVLYRWDAETGKELARLQLPADVAGYSEAGSVLSPDGSLLAVFSMDETLIRYLDPKAVKKPGDSDYRMCDGKTIRFLDTTTGKELRRVEGRLDMDFPSARFSLDGRTLTATSANGTVQIWETATGKVLHDFKALAVETQHIAISRNGAFVAATGRADEGLHLWDATKEKELHTFDGHRAGPLTVAFSHDGKTVFTTNRERERWGVVSAWADWSLHQWDPVSGKELRVTRPDLKAEVRWTTFSPDGRLLAVVTRDGVLRLWDADAGKELRQWTVPTRFPPVAGGRGAPSKIPYEAIFHPTFSVDAMTLWGASDETIHRWDVGTSKQLPKLGTAGYRNGLRCRPSPDGRTVLMAASGGGGTKMDLLDAKTGALVKSLKEVDMFDPDCVFSPDGRTLAATTSTGAVLRETATGNTRASFAGSSEDRDTLFSDYRTLAFSPDGRLLAVGAKDMVRLVDLASGRDVGKVAAPGWAASLAFSSDGKRLACGFDNTALICDVAALTAGNLPEPARLAAAEMDAQWDSLTSSDGARAYLAIGKLAMSDAEAAVFLKRRLKAEAMPVDAAVDGMIKALDDDDFETREKATAALERQGSRAGTALRRALATSKSAEVRSRAERLLQKTATASVIAQRAVEALERSREPEARTVLKELADGAPDAEPALAAAAALKRLNRLADGPAP